MAADRRPDRMRTHDLRPLRVLGTHVLAWVVLAVAVAAWFSVRESGGIAPEPLVVFGLFGAVVGVLTGMLHLIVRLVRS